MTSEELLTQVDENDNIIGVQPRSEFNNGKLIHRSVYLMIHNGQGEVLLRKRPVTKTWHPGLYTFSVTGSVRDETYDKCMFRRIQEEFGKAIPFQKVFKFHHFDEVDKAFKAVYEAVDGTVLDSSGKGFLWISLDVLKKELISNPEKFAPPFLTGMQLYFNRNRTKD